MSITRSEKCLALFMTIIMTFTVFGICKTDVAYGATKVLSLNLTNVGDTYTIQKGKKFKLKYSIQATKKKYRKVKWKSSNKKVLTVSSKGKIKGKKNGTAWVTVYARSNKKIKDKVFVRVGTPVSSISLGKGLYYIRTDKSETISRTVYPSSASNKSLCWWSSDPSIATVNQNGTVTGIKRGVVTISAQATDGWGAIGRTTVKIVHLLKDDSFFIAHRGYSAYYPENTLPAFRAAAASNFEGCEMDVWESTPYQVEVEDQQVEPATVGNSIDTDDENLDEEAIEVQSEEPKAVSTHTETRFDLMIMHNSTTGSMCGSSRNVSIKSINVTNRDQYPIIKGNGIGSVEKPVLIPTLEEALKTLHETNSEIVPVIELKASSYSNDAINEIMRLIGEYGGKATIISFNDSALNQAQQAINARGWRDNVDTQYLVSSASKTDVNLCVTRGYTGISIGYNHISRSISDYAHSNGLVVACWTLPSQVEAARVIDLGADRVTSNYRLFFDN